MRTHYILALLLLAGCTYDPNTGTSEAHPLVLSRPVWEIGQQGGNGSAAFCSVTAGDLQVSLRRDGQGLRQQVATSFDMHPGDSYSVSIGGHRYETPQDWFNSSDSDAIIQSMLGDPSNNLYTEMYSPRAANHDMQHNNQSDKIPLAGFAGQYQACKNYVQSSH